MGNLKSVQITGTGWNAGVGQSFSPETDWPRFEVTRYVRTIDYEARTSREEFTRRQGNFPPQGGGGTPIQGEQQQVFIVSGNSAWNLADGKPVPQPGQYLAGLPIAEFRQLDILLTPHGFLRAAMAATNATAVSLTLGSPTGAVTPNGKATLVSFTAMGKYRVVGTFDDQNLLALVHTWVPNPVYGDMLYELRYLNYKDFGGVKFPTHIVQRNGPYPILDLTVTEVKPNAAVSIAVPANIRNAPSAAPATLQAEKVSEGVWIVQGGAKSLALEMKDHIVVIEAPETEARSIAVIDAVKKAIPGKPIKYLINTHHHYDHAGGLRTYAAEGATIITHYTNIPFYENTWRNPRTISSDRLSKSGRTPVFEGVTGSRILSDGAREIDIYHYGGNMHNPGLLMIYLPRERMLIEADSWTPPAVTGDVPGAVVNLVNFYEAVQRLNLDVDQVVPIHGRLTTFDEIRQAVQTYGKTQYWTN
jgi:glyoxylase-like metal-dependent hydrolase (beta-lactamase superfamily II)